MGRLPSHVFVVRHGNRLDAADKKWHLTSPTPYDPPLTYGGLLQARQVGSQIASILESAKIEEDAASSKTSTRARRKRFKVVIHSSPFLRCVQTSIGISSGLAQGSPDALYAPADVLVPAISPGKGNASQPRSAVLRLDAFLGEWLSPEYFEMITPPPGSALMMGGAKAHLLRREDYSHLNDSAPHHHAHAASTGCLWSNSASSSTAASLQADSSETGSAVENSGTKETLKNQSTGKGGYAPPRPNYAVSSAGKIPEGFVGHARDACVAVDFQWDSARAPLDFGDGGQLPEEWAAMHERFRKGLKMMLNWYATAETPADMVTSQPQDGVNDAEAADGEETDVETVVVIVSHGAGCNALIGAITHQPVLMDVGIASITMALRKPDISYSHLRETLASPPSDQDLVLSHHMYDIRLSASTEHLYSTASTPISARSASISSTWNMGLRGRTPTMGSDGASVLTSLNLNDPSLFPGTRSTSASATLTQLGRRDSGNSRPSSRAFGPVFGDLGGRASSPPAGSSPTSGQPSGLWAPVPSSLRLMDGFEEEDEAEDFPNFGNFGSPVSRPSEGVKLFDSPFSNDAPSTLDMDDAPTFASPISTTAPPVQPLSTNLNIRGPIFAAPIKLKTDLFTDAPVDPPKLVQLGDGLGGLWGMPQTPDDTEPFRDLSQTKRRWTVNETS